MDHTATAEFESHTGLVVDPSHPGRLAREDH